jgi:hypothetical protein
VAVSYQVVLFLHVLGAIATFVGVGAWFFAVVAFRGARRVEELRIAGPMYRMGGALGLLGIVVLSAAGLDLALRAWSLGIGWILVATAAFVLLAPVGPLVVAPRLERIAREASGNGPLSDATLTRLRDPVLKAALLAVGGDLVGIVFLMTAKPPMLNAVIAMVAFIAGGLALAAPPIGKVVSLAVEALARLEASNPAYRFLSGPSAPEDSSRK